MNHMFSSPVIAKEMERIYGGKTEVIRMEIRHEEEVDSYVAEIEEAHNKAADSKLTFS